MFAGTHTHAFFSLQENRGCSINYLCLGAFLTFLGCILVCVLGFVVVLPHIATKDWQEKQCIVTSSALNQSVCACSEHIYSKRSLAGCQQTYPCLQIYVSLEAPADVSDFDADFKPGDRAGDTGKESKTDAGMQALKQSGQNGYASRQDNATNGAAHQSMGSHASVDNHHQSSSVKSRLTRHKHNELLLPFSVGGGTTAEGVDEQELRPVADAKERRNHSKTRQPQPQQQQSVDRTPTVAAAAAAAARHGTDDVTPAHVLLYRDWKDTYYEPVSTSC